MAGFPLTAWAIRHPRGGDADTLLEGLRADSGPEAVEAASGQTVAEALLDEIAPRCAEACERWGSSRVAVILGSVAPTRDQALTRLTTILGLVRTRTGIVGPAYHVAATGAGGAKALASAERLLRASLADAVLVGGVDEGQGALVLVEKHGRAFVQLLASAEATGLGDPRALDEAAARRALGGAWSAAGRPALGYVQLHGGTDQPSHAEAEQRVAEAMFGATPRTSMPASLRSMGAAAGAIDAVLAAASLLRGYTPEAEPRELQHDRVLVHAFSPGGHHVALLFEARP